MESDYPKGVEDMGVFNKQELIQKCQENAWLKRWGMAFQEDPFMDTDYSYSFMRYETLDELRKRAYFFNSLHPETNNQNRAAPTVDYLTKKRGYETIIALKEGPKTFNELQRTTGMSTATVTKAIRESESLRLIQRSYRSTNGSTVYELTEAGKSLEPKKFKATMKD